MADIFLSYSRDNQDIARRFAEAFERAGLSVWWDATLRSGEAYDEVTEKALRDAKAVVVLWSKKSVASRWVRAEATLADRNKTLVPVMIEPCDRPIMFELTQTADLSHWRGDDNDRAWRSYLADVRRFVETAGSQATMRPAAVASAPASRRFGGIALAMSAVLIVAAAVLWTLTRTGGEPATPTASESATAATPSASAATAPVTLAVLPFADLSPESDQEYFSDGLSEELLNVLAQIRELRVAGRTSSFAFKGRNEDLRVIAEQLGVANILEGSVRKSGNRLRITAQLISAADGYHLWSQTYDRELDDVFAVQEEIAMAVADALSIALGVGDVLRLGGTRDVTAYDVYLQGRAAGNASTAAGVQRARDLLTQATARDPQFAAAWIALGNANLGIATYSPERAGSALLESSEAFSRGISLLPEGRDREVVEAFAQWVVEGDLAGAGRSLARGQAVPLDVPPEFREPLGIYLIAVGRVREAVDMLNAAVTVDPLKTNASLWLQFALDFASSGDAAEAEYARLTARVPASVPMEFQKLERLWLAGAAPSELRAQYERFVALDGGFMPVNAALGPVLDDPAAARALIAAAIEDPFYQSFTRMGGLAQLAALFGDHDLALDALRRAHIGTRSTLVPQIWHPVFAPMRSDPRFKAIVRDAGIYEAWRATDEWSDFCRPLGEDDFECR